MKRKEAKQREAGVVKPPENRADGRGCRGLLVVGQGLVGTLLSFQKLDQGLPLKILDRGLKYSLSARTPALLSPLYTTDLIYPRFNQKKEEWKQLFGRIETRTGIGALIHKPTIHLFKTIAEKTAVEHMLTSSSPDLLAHPVPANTYMDVVGENAGGYEFRNTSYINSPDLLYHSRKYFEKEGLLIPSKFEKKDLIIDDSGLLKWKSMTLDTILFCTGGKLANSPYFQHTVLPTLEMATASYQVIPTIPRTHIIQMGHTTLYPVKDGSWTIITPQLPKIFPFQDTLDQRLYPMLTTCEHTLISPTSPNITAQVSLPL